MSSSPLRPLGPVRSGQIAGHLLLFSTRSRGFFFQRPFPQWKLFWAIMGTQVFAALMAANGWLVTEISWQLIGLFWAYNLVCLLVVDATKVELFHRCDASESGVSQWQGWLHMPLDASVAVWEGSPGR